MGYTQKPPKRPKEPTRKKILRSISRWRQLRLDRPDKLPFKPRSPFKGWTRLRRLTFVRVRPSERVRVKPAFPLKGPPGRASQETKFKDLPYVVSSNGSVTRGTQSCLVSQRIISTRYKTVNFRSKKNRDLKPLAYEMSLQQWHYGRLQVRDSLTYSGGGSSSFSDYPATSLGTPTLCSYTDRYADMEAILVNKALLKVKDLKFNLAQAFGERKQSVQLLASSVERLILAGRALKTGNFEALAKSLGVVTHKRKLVRVRKRYRRMTVGEYTPDSALANLWLEFKFGWMPILQDIYGAAETLAEFHRDRYTVSTVTARHKIVLKALASTYPYGSTGKTADSSTGTMNGRVTFRFRTGTGLFGTVPHMGLTDPLLLAWELLPFSFVADWALPIGDYLSALTATQGVTFLDGFVTYWTKRDGIRQIADVFDNGNPYFHQVTVKQGSFRTEVLNHRRDVYAAFPLPRLPVVKDPLSVDHVVTALALLRQTFRVR